jgi:mono/diheme cytochrome c family protein
MTCAPIRLLLSAFLLAGAATQVAARESASRGELLYRTHCIACHTTQMHWRDARRAVDWPSLVAQVTQWQGRAGLGWNGEDVDEVARWLNTTIYRFPRPERRG